MTDLEILKEMIADAARVDVVVSHDRGRSELIEPNCPDSRVTIHGLPMDSVVIKADCFPAPDSVFKGTRGECKRADFAIIAEKNGKTIIVYIEMKKTKALQHEIVNQLFGAQCFVHYCREVGRLFWKETNFLASAQHRFVSIGHTSIPKRPTQIKPDNGRHDRPDRMMKIRHQNNLQFNMLIGKMS